MATPVERELARQRVWALARRVAADETIARLLAVDPWIDLTFPNEVAARLVRFLPWLPNEAALV